MPDARQLRSVRFWEKKLAKSRAEISTILGEMGFELSPSAKTLPKGAVSKLRAWTDFSNAAPSIQPRQITPIDSQFLGEESFFELSIVGHKAEMRHLSVEDVNDVHYQLVRDFCQHSDPIEPAGVRERSLLESAIFRPHTSFGVDLKYPTIEMAAAALTHSLIHNHPFHNGNKRTALVSLLVFLDINNYMLACTEDELFKFILRVAQHRIVDSAVRPLADREVQGMAEWIRSKSRAIRRGERPISFRLLRQILNDFDCQFETGRRGGGLEISRTIKRETTKWFRTQTEWTHLSTYINYRGEGAEVQRNTLNKIRTDLQLDESHGIDSAAFYDDDSTPVGEFILRYRKILNRLSKL